MDCNKSSVVVEKQAIMEMDGKSIQYRFEAFDKANPEVYNHFKKFTFEVIRLRKKIGAKAVMERVRWEVVLTTKGSSFKINNTFTSRYARKFSEEYPEHASLFATRRLLRD